MSEYKKHREFIHDISNHIAIADGAVRRIKLLSDKEQTDDVKEDLEKHYQLSDKYMKECINKLKEYRLFIHELEDKIK